MKWFVLCFFLFTTLHAEEAEIEIESDEAFFESDQLVLIDQIDADYGIGRISAKKLSINRILQEGSSLVSISGDMTIALDEGGNLSCKEALINYSLLQATFKGNEQEPLICYNNPSFHGFPLEMKGTLIEASFEKAPDKSKGRLSQFHLSEIKVIENISVLYRDYLIRAEKAEMIVQDSFIRLTGSPCYLEGKMGTLTCSSIAVDAKQSNIIFTDPRGTLLNSDSTSFQVSAKEGVLEKSILTLTLKGDPLVHIQGEKEDLFSKEAVIRYKMTENKPKVDHILLKGTVTIKRNEASSQLIKAEEVEILPDSFSMWIKGSKDEKVFVSDALNQLELSAEELKISFSPNLEKEKIEGVGKVRCTFMRK